MTTVQGQKVNVTRSRAVSADKNAITRQCMVISTWNLVGIIYAGVDACGMLFRSVGQTNQKLKIWRTFSMKNPKINGKCRQIAEILHYNKKSGSANRKAVSKFTPKCISHRFCTCAVQMLLKMAVRLNAQLLKSYTVNRRRRERLQ